VSGALALLVTVQYFVHLAVHIQCLRHATRRIWSVCGQLGLWFPTAAVHLGYGVLSWPQDAARVGGVDQAFFVVARRSDVKRASGMNPDSK